MKGNRIRKLHLGKGDRHQGLSILYHVSKATILDYGLLSLHKTIPALLKVSTEFEFIKELNATQIQPYKVMLTLIF